MDCLNLSFKSRCLLFLCLFYTSDQYVSIDALKYDIDGNYLQQYLQRFQSVTKRY